MKTYHCTCGQQIYFENIVCMNCSRELGFLPDELVLSSLESTKDGFFTASTPAPETKGKLYKKCYNYQQHNACNWMVSSEKKEEVFCTSCRLDQMIPDLTLPENVNWWKLIEAAKRRMVYSLLSLKLPVLNRLDDPKQGMSFKFLADLGPNNVILTGHDEGVITLNIAEADDAEREKRRLSMNEPYRTLLGHFRHEIGHYYWDRLISGTKYLEPFRAVFGDERADYGEALKTYYANGAPADWQTRFISVYATAHPWEDWAESWAHYLHIQDTLEVALDFGLVDKRTTLTGSKDTGWFAPKAKSFDEVIGSWSQLVIALNNLNRSMGLRDLYPFVLSQPVVDKLKFISEVIKGSEV